MATVHAFVRAYSLEPEKTLASLAMGAEFGKQRAGNALPRNGDGDADSLPGSLMATLNYQLFRSTPPEKYATMFLGCYDAASRVVDLLQRRPPASAGAGQQRQCHAAGNVRHRGGTCSMA